MVYGATGFTGKEVVRYLHNKNFENLTWGISGRSESKLIALKEELNLREDVPVLIANNTNPDSLVSAFSQATIVLNCTGKRIYEFTSKQVMYRL